MDCIARSKQPRLPQALRAERRELLVVGDDRHPLLDRLRGEDAVERIAVDQRQATRFDSMSRGRFEMPRSRLQSVSLKLGMRAALRLAHHHSRFTP
jgi:hypothetical protein